MLCPYRLWSANAVESTILKESYSSRRLLVALAHPDDETFGLAGTIIHYARQGVAVHYVCATRGEAGHVDPTLLEGYTSLAELRIQELRCAARHLGLSGLHLLDHRDSGMEGAPENQHPASLFQAPLEEVVEKIVYLVRKTRPQVVITFDPTGGYFHPDHIKMHQATTLAFHAAGDAEEFPWHQEDGLLAYSPQKLYYTAFPQMLAKLAVKILPLFGQDPAALGHNQDINLRRIADQRQIITTKLNVSSYAKASQRASQCYASQMPAGREGIQGMLSRLIFRHDRYTRVVPRFTADQTERDLFAGIDDQ
jgi:LmbE family N-acetylglucosaminyl deacetylase